MVYKPRSGKVNSNMSKFSPALITLIKSELGQMLKRFGYVKIGSEEPFD
jgi:hypothetical protein